MNAAINQSQTKNTINFLSTTLFFNLSLLLLNATECDYQIEGSGEGKRIRCGSIAFLVASVQSSHFSRLSAKLSNLKAPECILQASMLKIKQNINNLFYKTRIIIA